MYKKDIFVLKKRSSIFAHFYKKLRYNLDKFFETEIEPLFDEPGFFGKLFGQTPTNKAEKLKNKLLKLGDRKFRDFEMRALKEPSLRWL